MDIYKIPEKYFFRLHHIRPRFKIDVEEVLLYVATSISDLGVMPTKEFEEELRRVLFSFQKNKTKSKKTIDNWRTEISTLFSFVLTQNEISKPTRMAIRLAESQYLDEFFNYFLYSFQYPGGHIKAHSIIPQIVNSIRFKPCWFILRLLTEIENITKKKYAITPEELTQCAYFDLRVLTGTRTVKEVANLIIKNRKNKIRL